MALAMKSCPRCRGDLFVEDDLFTIDVVCLQCGQRRSVERRAVDRLARSRLKAAA